MREDTTITEEVFIRVSCASRIVGDDDRNPGTLDKAGVFVVDDDEFGATVLEDVGDFRNCEACVDGTNDSSCGEDTVMGLSNDWPVECWRQNTMPS